MDASLLDIILDLIPRSRQFNEGEKPIGQHSKTLEIGTREGHDNASLPLARLGLQSAPGRSLPKCFGRFLKHDYAGAPETFRAGQQDSVQRPQE